MESIANTIELQSCIEELNIIKKEFEVYRLELNYQKAKKQRIEAIVRKDLQERGDQSAQTFKITNLCQIYEGEW